MFFRGLQKRISFDDDTAKNKVRSNLQFLEEDFDEIIDSFDEGLAKMKENCYKSKILLVV